MSDSETRDSVEMDGHTIEEGDEVTYSYKLTGNNPGHWSERSESTETVSKVRHDGGFETESGNIIWSDRRVSHRDEDFTILRIVRLGEIARIHNVE